MINAAGETAASSGAAGSLATPTANTSTAAATVTNEIETVAMITAHGIPSFPALLFKGGYGTEQSNQAIWSIAQINAAMTSAPQDWFQWRRGANGLERNKDQQWEPFNGEIPPASPNESFAYFRVNTATGVGSLIVQEDWSYSLRGGSYQFCHSEKDGGAPGGLSDTRRTTDSGSYTIAGYVVHMVSADGTRRDNLLLYRPAAFPSLPGSLWIDGTTWYAGKTASDMLCAY